MSDFCLEVGGRYRAPDSGTDLEAGRCGSGVARSRLLPGARNSGTDLEAGMRSVSPPLVYPITKSRKQIRNILSVHIKNVSQFPW